MLVTSPTYCVILNEPCIHRQSLAHKFPRIVRNLNLSPVGMNWIAEITVMGARAVVGRVAANLTQWVSLLGTPTPTWLDPVPNCNVWVVVGGYKEKTSGSARSIWQVLPAVQWQLTVHPVGLLNVRGDNLKKDHLNTAKARKSIPIPSSE